MSHTHRERGIKSNKTEQTRSVPPPHPTRVWECSFSFVHQSALKLNHRLTDSQTLPSFHIHLHFHLHFHFSTSNGVVFALALGPRPAPHANATAEKRSPHKHKDKHKHKHDGQQQCIQFWFRDFETIPHRAGVGRSDGVLEVIAAVELELVSSSQSESCHCQCQWQGQSWFQSTDSVCGPHSYSTHAIQPAAPVVAGSNSRVCHVHVHVHVISRMTSPHNGLQHLR